MISEPLINIDQAAEKLSVSTMTVRRLIWKKAIPYRKIGAKYFFTADDLLEFLAFVRRPIQPGDCA